MVRTPWNFWRNIIGTSTILLAMFLCLGIFAVGYLPTFAQQSLPQQITIVAAAVFNILFLSVLIAMFFASLINERPR